MPLPEDDSGRGDAKNVTPAKVKDQLPLAGGCNAIVITAGVGCGSENTVRPSQSTGPAVEPAASTRPPGADTVNLQPMGDWGAYLGGGVWRG